MNPDESSVGTGRPLTVERWPSEIPLLVLVGLCAAAIWALLALTILGAVYAVMIGLFLFVTHLGFIAYLRGSAVRLGPEQFPELHERVRELSARAGLACPPEAYIMQAGGSLNALATRFLRSGMIVLFSDLLEACGDNEAARDMIIGHELGHLKAGHLRFQWFLFPGFLVPFLGMAYSRAREYTCDRYGAALCGDPRAALVGLGILAAGGAHGRRVNLQALAQQRELLNTGWMTLGKWFSTHPPLSDRIAQLEPRFVAGQPPPVRGRVRAMGILAVLLLLPAGGLLVALSTFLPRFQEAMAQARAEIEAQQRRNGPALGPFDDILDDLDALAVVAESVRDETGSYPSSDEDLYLHWDAMIMGSEAPMDPYDGQRYGYMIEEDHFLVWSSGPDAQSGTDDDIWLDSRDREED